MVFGFLRRKRELSHGEAGELLSSYLDRQLSLGDAARLEAHLQDCPVCCNELEALRATRQLMRALPPVHSPRSFTLQAAPRPVPLPKSFVYLRAATGLAAAVFVALLGARALLPMAGAYPGPAHYATEAAARTTAAGQPSATGDAFKDARPSGRPAAEPQAKPAATPQSVPTTAAGAQAAPMRAAAPTVASAPAAGAAEAAPAALPSSRAADSKPGAGSQADVAEGTARKAEMVPSEQRTLVPPTPAGAQSAEEIGQLSLLLQAALVTTGMLALLLATITSALWWRYRRHTS